MKKVTAVLIGAGGRGAGAYGSYILAHPDEISLVSLAEPDPEKRDRVGTIHGIPKEMRFSGWEELLSKPKLADTALICTQDRMHYKPAMEAISKGYHILLEKPMAVDPAECVTIAKHAKNNNTILSVCHVLRYTEFFTMMKKLLNEKAIGKLVSIQHNENVGYWHQAMSYIRGSWRNSLESSPMILAKCCHDMDLLTWFIGSNCKYISSYGSLTYFKNANAPPGAPEFCQDGCPVQDSCPWYAPRFYLDGFYTEWATGCPENANREEQLNALRRSGHGRCVFRCDNDVVDHQVVCAEFENEVTVAFTMCAFTNDCNRTIKLMGTKGEIRGDLNKNEIEMIDFLTGKRQIISTACEDETGYGHGGGDFGIMRDFVELIRKGYSKEAEQSANTSLQGHLMAFAAEQSRIEKKSVDMREYIAKF